MTSLLSSRLPISALVVIHNEEKLLDRCLKSCADLVSEIIVIHDGPCNDRSLEIAKRYTDRIFVEPRIGEAEPHRVFALKQASYDWVLFLDGDEFLSEELRQHLPELVINKTYEGYDLTWPTWYKGRYYIAYAKRALFRKSRFYFIGAPHEYVRPLKTDIRTCRIPYILEHKPPYDNLTWQTFRRKWLPWTRIHARYYTQPFYTLETYNCSLTEWPPAIRYRIDHPVVLGMIGSSMVHLGFGLYHFIRRPHLLFLKSGLMMAAYHFCLYYYVWKYRA